MKVRDLFSDLESKGWSLARISGSHHIFVHPKAIRPIPVPVHGKEIPNVVAKAILKQAEAALKKG